MGQPVQLLENALQAWEDCFLLFESRVRVGIEVGTRKREELVGPVRHWRELRNHLLNLKGGDFDLKRFCHTNAGVGLTSGPFAKAMIEMYQMSEEDLAEQDAASYKSLPLQLASWIVSSRRVFHLSSELVDRFLAADYSAYKWTDLLWPFDSFFISFESPRKWTRSTGEQNETLGFLISSVYGVCPEHELGQRDGFECLPFFRDVNRTHESILTEKERERIENDIRHKRWKKLNRRASNAYLNMSGISTDEMMRGLPPTEEGAIGLPPGHGPAIRFSKMQRVEPHMEDKLLAGLCLYLEALPVGTMDAYSWHQSVPIKSRREVRKIITDGEQICRVEDFNVISPDTITLFPEILRMGPAYSVTPHWRRAHYRRKKGQGKNPDAPRDVYIGPRLVNKDQLPEGAVPGGASSSVR